MNIKCYEALLCTTKKNRIPFTTNVFHLAITVDYGASVIVSTVERLDHIITYVYHVCLNVGPGYTENMSQLQITLLVYFCEMACIAFRFTCIWMPGYCQLPVCTNHTSGLKYQKISIWTPMSFYKNFHHWLLIAWHRWQTTAVRAEMSI